MNKELIYNLLEEVYSISIDEKMEQIMSDFEESTSFNSEDMQNASLYCKAFVKYYMHYDMSSDMNEDAGMAMATAGNVSGMGPVVTPIAGSTPGVPNGASGSGDIGAGRMANVRSRDSHLPRSRRKAKAKQAVKNMKKSIPSHNPFLDPIQKTPGAKKASSILTFSAFKESIDYKEEKE